MDYYVFKESELEAVDDSNGLERLKELEIKKSANPIIILADEIDMRDGIKGNDVKVNQIKKLANNIFHSCSFALNHNWKQQRIFDLKFTSEGKNNRQPLEAA